MPLPAGFKVNGFKTTASSGMPIPPRVRKVTTILDRLPFEELLTTQEVAGRAGFSNSGSVICHPAFEPYREKVDGKLFWGSRQSIAKLRKQLAEPEETNDKN